MKNVLILGAASDMARSVASIYATQGATLALAGRSMEGLDILAKDLKIKYNISVTIHYFDASQGYDDHKKFYNALPYKPTVVVCAFGYLGDQQRAQLDWKEAQEIITANYTGAVSILNIIANDFEQRREGTIVGISSVAGDRGRQSNYLYGSAKAGFTAYLSGMRNRLFKSGVHVVTVKPGFVATKMTIGLPLPKPLTAQPDQVAKKIISAIDRKKNIIYVLPVWRLIMLIITSIPEFMFKKLKL